MLKSKSFVKKTRKGSIIKVVREHYLRDDIWCGSQACSQCNQQELILEKSPSSGSDICKFPHYLLPDTNVVLHQVLDSNFANTKLSSILKTENLRNELTSIMI